MSMFLQTQDVLLYQELNDLWIKNEFVFTQFN